MTFDNGILIARKDNLTRLNGLFQYRAYGFWRVMVTVLRIELHELQNLTGKKKEEARFVVHMYSLQEGLGTLVTEDTPVLLVLSLEHETTLQEREHFT